MDVKADGTIEVFSAVNQMGRGIATTLAQLVVDVFDADRAREGHPGRHRPWRRLWQRGSRSLFTGGSAMRIGSERTIDHAKQLAAKELEAAAEDIAYAAGRFRSRARMWAFDLFSAGAKRPQAGGVIHRTGTSAVSGPAWPNGCHMSEVETKTPPPVRCRWCATAASTTWAGVNPMIVRGQLDGGAVQGIGQALQKHGLRPPTGQPVTGNLMDQPAPRAPTTWPATSSPMDESTPCKNNPLGVKGVGELGTIGATPSVVNAVARRACWRARCAKAAVAPTIPGCR